MNATVSFMVPVQEELRAVEDLMRRQAEGYHLDLGAALELLVSAGGKRIRPALTILVGKILGAPADKLVTMAAAIELLHTATLVHDDLIDGALLRRGMPTLNSKWSAGATVLTGDFLFSRAALLAAQTESVPVIKLFSRTLTTIVNGEIVQLLGSRCSADEENYTRRIYAKTASLFETSAQSAAIIGAAQPALEEALRNFGYQVGMAFQIIDDILDYTGDQATVGKPIGSDLRQGIVTLPAIRYTTSHPDDPRACKLRIGECLEDSEIDLLVASIRESDAIRSSHQQAVDYVERALEILKDFPACPERFALEEMAGYVVERRF